jgi:hypothetical protein
MFPFGFGDSCFSLIFKLRVVSKLFPIDVGPLFARWSMVLYATGAFLVSSDAGFGIQVKQIWVFFGPELGFGI